jgi:regulator of CtrA degradation
MVRLYQQAMGHALTINHRIVEGLYTEALVLSDEVRHAFALHAAASDDGAGRALDIKGYASERTRAAMSAEGLRTTTRMMHAVSWLLNHRAHFTGELSAFQLKRYGRLAPDVQRSDAADLALVSPEVQELVGATTRFYDRLLRLDRTWRRAQDNAPSAIAALRERLEQRLLG